MSEAYEIARYLCIQGVQIFGDLNNVLEQGLPITHK